MLQGSLEKFSLDEVLGLLSNTSKTGHLEIAGDRGNGSLFFSNGKLVDAKASNAGNGNNLEDVMFELLRFKEGTFNFDSRKVDPSDDSSSVDLVLVGAESRLRDWQQIEAIVPSLAHMITPVPELPDEEVTITRTDWSAITTIAAGCPVSVVCEELELGEVEGSRLVKDLSERKLVSISEPSTGRIQSNSLATPESLSSESLTTESSTTESSTADTFSSDTSSAYATADQLDSFGQNQPMAIDERPPIPPPPGGFDPLGTDEGGLDDLVPPPPPAPPSPSEISEFDVDDVSELVDGDDAADGGLLMQYLSGDD